MEHFKKIKWFISLIAFLALGNPTGYSLTHHALNGHDWGMTKSTGFFVLFICIAAGAACFFLWQSWRSIDWAGRLIFIFMGAPMLFILYVMGLLNSTNKMAWIAIGFLYIFTLWGMIYPRVKLALFKTRNVDDADTEGEIQILTE